VLCTNTAWGLLLSWFLDYVERHLVWFFERGICPSLGSVRTRTERGCISMSQVVLEAQPLYSSDTWQYRMRPQSQRASNSGSSRILNIFDDFLDGRYATRGSWTHKPEWPETAFDRTTTWLSFCSLISHLFSTYFSPVLLHQHTIFHFLSVLGIFNKTF